MSSSVSLQHAALPSSVAKVELRGPCSTATRTFKWAALMVATNLLGPARRMWAFFLPRNSSWPPL
eukprot:7055010-Pyramimonas_sp.AAC.1